MREHSEHFRSDRLPSTAALRAEVEADVAGFLAAGNEIERVPAGVSGLGPDGHVPKRKSGKAGPGRPRRGPPLRIRGHRPPRVERDGDGFVVRTDGGTR